MNEQAVKEAKIAIDALRRLSGRSEFDYVESPDRSNALWRVIGTLEGIVEFYKVRNEA